MSSSLLCLRTWKRCLNQMAINQTNQGAGSKPLPLPPNDKSRYHFYSGCQIPASSHPDGLRDGCLTTGRRCESDLLSRVDSAEYTKGRIDGTWQRITLHSPNIAFAGVAGKVGLRREETLFLFCMYPPPWSSLANQSGREMKPLLFLRPSCHSTHADGLSLVNVTWPSREEQRKK